jgi:methionyl-tRNA formyltransferase
MMLEIINNIELDSVDICGVVNLNSIQAINKANYDDYFDLTQQFEIPIFYCDNVNDEETVDWIRGKHPDLIIQSGWSQKFSSEVLSIPKFGCIGEHPAPLPRGRGAACVNWAILTGETNWGDSFFKMIDEYDKGDLYAQRYFSIEHHDDVASVYDKVAFSSKEIVRENIANWVNGIFQPIIQDETQVTYYKKRVPADGLINFNNTAIDVYNFIRAQTKPYPGAFFTFQNLNIKVWKAELTSIVTSRKSGTIIGVEKNGGLLVSCGDGNVINLLRLQADNQPECWGNKLYFDNKDVTMIVDKRVWGK